jgi:hypothetical protein
MMQWSILLSCTCHPPQEIVPGDRRMALQTGGKKKKKKLSPDNNDSIQPIVAANAFVQVIMMLRKTFIQYTVLMMMELRPCHPI